VTGDGELGSAAKRRRGRRGGGPAGAPAIETHELRKEFGRIVALAGLTMTVPRGEVFGFLGPNGAGKTTAVKLLLGLSRPTAGEGRRPGGAARRCGGAAAHRLPAGAVPLPGLDDRARGPGLHCELARLPGPSWQAGDPKPLELVGLADRADDSRTETFSKGMQQRLGLGVALLGRPDLVVLDEPTSALDPVGRQDVRPIIGSLRDRGTTVFLNSHLLTEVERVCDRVAIVDHGRVVAELSMAELAQERGVSVRVTGLDGASPGSGGPLRPTRLDGEWLVVDGIADADVPGSSASWWRAAAPIHAVVPTRHTLEERFLSLLGAAPGRRPGGGADRWLRRATR
jgi:ABC-2 type transport system ATP-binding protein